MRLSRTLVAVVLITVALCATGGCSGPRVSLDGTQWKLTEWTLSSLNPADFAITATFAEGRISGNSGVDSYGGPYTLGPDDAFSTGSITSTAMAGPEDAMRAEGAYLTLLGQAKSYKMADDVLTLYDEGGNESLIFGGTGP